MQVQRARLPDSRRGIETKPAIRGPGQAVCPWIGDTPSGVPSALVGSCRPAPGHIGATLGEIAANRRIRSRVAWYSDPTPRRRPTGMPHMGTVHHPATDLDQCIPQGREGSVPHTRRQDQPPRITTRTDLCPMEFQLDGALTTDSQGLRT
jgi:hypothetical protein